MKSLIEKDQKRRKLYVLFEKKRVILKYICYNLKFSEKLRKQAQNQLIKLPRNSSKTRLKNRCVITSRPRAIYRKFKISRLLLRKFALEGKLPGVKKANW